MEGISRVCSGMVMVGSSESAMLLATVFTWVGFGQAWGEDGDVASGGEREIKGGRVEEGGL